MRTKRSAHSKAKANGNHSRDRAGQSNKQINKGLDLEGGINVILQISVKDVLRGLANESKNAVFNKALDNAAKIQQGNESYLDAFFRAFDEAATGTSVKLASPDIFANRNSRSM